MQKAPYVFPIIGGRKVEHLMANIEALEISLSDDQIKFLESVVPFDPGFPNSMIVSWFFVQSPCIFTTPFPQGDGKEYSFLFASSGTVTKGPLLQPLRP